MTKIKKKHLAFLLYFIHASLAAQQPLELIPYRTGDLWGYTDVNGRMVVPVQFDEAYPFVRKLEMLDPYFNAEYEQTIWPDLESPVAVVKKNGLYGLLGSKGQVLSAPVSDTMFQFEPASKGTFWVRYSDGSTSQEGYGLLKNALLYDGGSKLTPFDYEHMDDDPGCGYQGYDDYYSFIRTEAPEYLVVSQKGKSGIISIKGKEIIPPFWDHVHPDEHGYTLARSDQDTVLMDGYSGIGYYLLNPQNKIIKKLPNVNYCQGYAGQGLWVVQNHEGEFFLINIKGERAMPGYFSEFFGFNSHGYGIVRDSIGKYRVINTDGKTVYNLPLEGQWKKYSEGYWMFEKDSLWYRYDHHFQKAEKMGYIEPFAEVSLCEKKYWVYKSKDGLWRIKNNHEVQQAFDFNVLGPVFYQADDWGRKFDLQFLRIEKNGKNGLTDCRLHEVVPPQFQYFSLAYGPNIWLVSDAGKHGIFDASKKQMVLPMEFDEIKYYSGSPKPVLAVRIGKYWGEFDIEGKQIFPVIYEEDIGDTPFPKLIKSKKGWHIFDETSKEVSTLTLPPFDENTYPSVNKYQLGGQDIFGVLLQIKGKNALYNQWGQMLIPPDYDDLAIGNEYIFARKEGKAGVLLYPELCEFISFKYNYIVYSEGKFILEKSKERIYYDPVSHKKISIQSPKYSMHGWFREGLVVAMKDCNYGFLDEQLNEVIPLQYRNAFSFYEGLAAVEKKGNLWGFINKQGEEVIKPKYSQVESFRQGKSIVRFYQWPDSTLWSSIIDRSGRALITAPDISRHGPFILVWKSLNVFAILDSNLHPILDACYITEKNEREGYIYYLENGRPGFLSPDGTKKSADSKFIRQEYSDGRVGITYFSTWGLQDQQGHWLIPLAPQWPASDVNAETFILRKDEKVGWFDRNGNVLIPFQDAYLEVKGGFCEANNNGLLGLYDLKGKLIVPAKFSAIEVLLKLGLIKVTTPENKVGFFDFRGRPYFKD